MIKKTNEMEDEYKEIEKNLSKIENRVDNIESVLKMLDSDMDRLGLQRKNILKEIRTLEKIKDDLAELQRWKDRAFERINNQDTRLDDRLRELKNLEDRVEKAVILLGDKVEEAMKNQRSYFEEEISKIDSRLKKFEDFENRVTTFMNEIVEEYEKRFEILKGEIEMAPYAFPTIKEKPSTFLNKIKKIIVGKKQRISELEKKVKEQHRLIKKMMVELEDLTKNSKSGDENV